MCVSSSGPGCPCVPALQRADLLALVQLLLSTYCASAKLLVRMQLLRVQFTRVELDRPVLGQHTARPTLGARSSPAS
ncbi:hypothetical protein PF005_g14518 [Phytophthora fragariae]|nr:hypothetical protein PF009_g10064 [Phytophthora fragariae]KAE9013762.1 hypothetical protein PF011_g8343 [Phytophthora fragariae]KAE9116992.1 hypothetical protein PF010_g8751 [Phytophthora fragariae]KAE9118049.1 hypothetical protein PF007_g9068 [Phytophthora fragariae]KAE9145742.1 hypothetical protein PF006_g9434 [Phytophthora fragariae]